MDCLIKLAAFPGDFVLLMGSISSMKNRETQFNQAIELLKPFTAKNIRRANWYFFSTIFVFWTSVLLSAYFVVFFPLGLLLSIPITTAFMCRSYVIEHDCGHGSFYRTETANFIAGNLMGFGILIPYSLWKYIHHSHHMHVGNLDKRSFNPEIWTMTLDEYRNSAVMKRLAYRFMRSKFTRFTLTPTINLGLMFRLIHPRFNWKANVSVVLHDLLYAFILWKIHAYFSWTNLFIIFYIPLVIFYFVASYTFYAQHQFEDTYWEKEDLWHYQEASFYGATYIAAPKWYCWLTGNVVFHNIHHLMSGIPFYRLEEAKERFGQTLPFRMIPLSEVWKMLSLKVWDENQKKLVPIPRNQK
jgi:omega-6 fatty acid desaturase (delta-12 desaturase)